MKNGTYKDLSNKDYHADDAIGSTMLKIYAECPQKFIHTRCSEPESTDSMDLGTAVHCLVLTPENFDEEVRIAPHCDKRTKEGKETWAHFCESSAKLVITEAQYAIAVAIAAAVYAHPEASRLINQTGLEFEHSGFWDDPGTGIQCKYRPDIRSSNWIADLKTTSDASTSGFSRSIAQYGYHVSAAHYLEGDRVLRGTEHNKFIFIAVETKPPFAVAVYVLGDIALKEGQRIRSKALDGIYNSNVSGEWPSYNDGVATEIDLPKWAYYNND